MELVGIQQVGVAGILEEVRTRAEHTGQVAQLAVASFDRTFNNYRISSLILDIFKLMNFQTSQQINTAGHSPSEYS